MVHHFHLPHFQSTLQVSVCCKIMTAVHCFRTFKFINLLVLLSNAHFTIFTSDWWISNSVHFCCWSACECVKTGFRDCSAQRWTRFRSILGLGWVEFLASVVGYVGFNVTVMVGSNDCVLLFLARVKWKSVHSLGHSAMTLSRQTEFWFLSAQDSTVVVSTMRLLVEFTVKRGLRAGLCIVTPRTWNW